MNRYDTNGNGTLPGSLTWSQLCNFIRNIEDGIEGVALHFWIPCVCHGLQIWLTT